MAYKNFLLGQRTSSKYMELLELPSKSATQGSNYVDDPTPFAGQPSARKARKITPSWRLGVKSWAFLTMIVLLTNVIFTIVIGQLSGFPGGLGTLTTGKCDNIRRYNITAHLAINILSTLLLSGCNYCMQCLSAPNRYEIDKAHSRGVSLDIGIPTVQNFRFLDRRKLILWCLLGFCSLPLHLLWNSVVYASISMNNYVVYSVNTAFTLPNSMSSSPLLSTLGNISKELIDPFSDQGKIAIQLHQAAVSNNLQRLENYDCIKAYANDYLSTRSNLLLVSPPSVDNSTDPRILENYFVDNAGSLGNHFGCVADPYPWICHPRIDCAHRCQDNLGVLLAQPSSWKPWGREIAYCLSQPVEEKCKLHFSLAIAVVVVFFNACQVVVMLILAFGMHEERIITIGDAAASFLLKPDEQTKGCCLTKASQFRDSGLDLWQHPLAKSWIAERARFSQSCTLRHWLLFYILYSGAIALCIVLLGFGISKTTPSLGTHTTASLFNLGLGTLTPETIIQWLLPTAGTEGFLTSVFIANIPQITLSLLHFIYNALLTAMLSGLEWSKFAWERRGLRVSRKPVGAQKSTFFLQLPFRYGLPLLALSGSVQWLLSQGIFMVAIEVYNPMGEPAGSDVADCILYGYKPGCLESPTRYTCSWSPIAVLAVIGAGLLMMAVASIMGTRRYKPGMPLGGNSSAVISAACHVAETDKPEKVEQLKLKWGVVSSESAELVHCAPSIGERTFLQAQLLQRWSETETQSSELLDVWFESGLACPETGKVGHCALSTKDPAFPQEGQLYM